MEKRRPDLVVVDASFVLGAFLPGSTRVAAQEVLAGAWHGDVVFYAPELLRLECLNAILRSYRAAVVTEEHMYEYIALLDTLPVRYDGHGLTEDIARLAHRFSLSSYDATYLELANRRNIELATYDKALQRAAKELDLLGSYL